jgi:hypothetical protein
MGGGGGGTNTVTRTELDPVMRPFVQYGLQESTRLYQQPNMPQYYPGQTYVSPSQQTQAALQAAQQRATVGNPLTPVAQQQALNTLQGGYLGGNPFFEGAFRAATQGAQTAYQDQVQQALSNASRAGRYGSGAMGTALDRAGGVFANALTNTAGTLAYQNYADERARQQAMIGAAPTLAQADYEDINKMLQLGQVAEGYQETAIADAVNRFNFAQQAPYQKLQSYLSGAYGAPSGMQVSQPVYRNQFGNVLGGAITGAALGGLGQGTSQYAPAIGAAIGGGLGLLG